MTGASVGIIGGTGVYAIEALTDVKTIQVETPFGDPSDAITLGTLGTTRIAFLPRHGKGHRLLPSEVPARANIWALKSLGVGQIISVSAVGSLRDHIAPLDLVVPGQIIDLTSGRPSTFFGQGLVTHISFSHPYCPVLAHKLGEAAERVGATVHRGVTCVTTNGPRFSTRAESLRYRDMGGDVIGMTAMPEAQLAREAEICYSGLSAITDYDTWHNAHESVTVDMILGNLARNTAVVKATLESVISDLPNRDGCECADALQDALVTPFDAVPPEVLHDLEPIVGRYVLRSHDTKTR